MQLSAGAAAAAIIVPAALAVALTACGRPAHGTQAASRHRSGRAAAAAPARPAVFQTTRTFQLAAGRSTRTFTFREPGGVILLNQLTARRGVRVFVEASIPHLAGAAVWSWPRRDGIFADCRPDRTLQICAVSEEWCPMPQATWQFRLVKLGGPAGPVRFDYVVAPPPGS